ncbi:FkbM family methyltransferase, partial [Acidobacteriia bacterium AH_259_A11_L15]|nr:FkbM family methyltransferase [Acidobacteriia bacterium AH_259_A11_L15]
FSCRAAFRLGMHEMAVQRALERDVRAGMTVYDIGAHLGFFTLGLARLVGPAGKVFAFEPLPENARALRENVALNDSLAGRVRVVEAAVSEASGRRAFYGQVNSAQGRLGGPGARPCQTYQVKTLALDDFVFSRREPAPHLIKLDAEGAEGAALQGARRLLEEARPVCLLEVHGEEAARAVWEVLQAVGYQVVSLERKKRLGAPEELAWGHV